ALSGCGGRGLFRGNDLSSVQPIRSRHHERCPERHTEVARRAASKDQDCLLSRDVRRRVADVRMARSGSRAEDADRSLSNYLLRQSDAHGMRMSVARSSCVGVMSGIGWVLCACSHSPGTSAVITIRGGEHLAWDQQAIDAAQLGGFRYAIYVDGTRSELDGA